MKKPFTMRLRRLTEALMPVVVIKESLEGRPMISASGAAKQGKFAVDGVAIPSILTTSLDTVEWSAPTRSRCSADTVSSLDTLSGIAKINPQWFARIVERKVSSDNQCLSDKLVSKFPN